MASIKVSGSLYPSVPDTPLDERSRIESLSELDSIRNPHEGLVIYVKDIKKTYVVKNVNYDEDNDKFYITERDISSIGGAEVFFSEGVEPEDINTIWVDDADSSSMLDETLFSKIRTELNKLSNRISDIEYAFDVKLDSGDTTYYKGSDLSNIAGVSPETDYDIQLMFTYDGNTLMFHSTDELNDTLPSNVHKATLLNDSEVVGEYLFNTIGVTADKEYVIGALDNLEFDQFQITDSEGEVLYKADLSSSALLVDSPSWSARLQPNVHHICIKRATNTALLGEYQIQDGEFVYSTSDNKLYIGNNGKKVQVNGGGASSGNISAQYIDLLSEDNVTTYRITISANGELIITNKALIDEDDTPSQVAGAAGSRNLAGLMISMVYAGPSNANATTTGCCSHSYIELFNGSAYDITLKGCSLQIGTTTWNKVIPLKGTIPAGHCYLVRLNPVANPSTAAVNINKFDLDAYALDNEIKLSSEGFKVYLCIGGSVTTYDSPYDQNNSKINSQVVGYIDLVGFMDSTSTKYINGGEFKPGETAPRYLSNTRGVYRKRLADKLYNSNLGDSDSNSADFLPFDYTVTNSPITGTEMVNSATIYKPYCTSDGVKNVYYNKTKFVRNKPNMPTFSIGETPNTRTFNWISLDNYDEYLYYRVHGQSTWSEVLADQSVNYGRQTIVGDDGVVFYVHKVILTGLASGIYDWKIVRKNTTYESDIYNFVVSDNGLSSEGSFTFMQVSDQQGWMFEEYEPWNIAAKKALEPAADHQGILPQDSRDDDFIHFLLNTGDMTQNGLRPSEWLDYYNQAKDYLPNIAQMNTVGNNDLCPGVKADGTTGQKVSPTTFEYFYTYQYATDETEASKQKVTIGGKEQFMKSVYAFDYGCAHFVCINSNNYIEEQKAWFEYHMQQVKAREVQPKWLIVYTHDAPFNIMVKRPGWTGDSKFLASWSSVGQSGMRDTGLNQQSTVDPEKMFTWSRLFEKYGIDLVLSGHKHTYSRTYPLIENTVDPEIADSSINVNNVQVNPWDPMFTTTGRNITAGGSTKKGVVYVMCQATGYKLQSNKDIPVPGIPWLAKYYPGTVNGSTIKVNADQKNPTYIKWNITPEQINMTAYQITNLTTGSKWDSLNGGDSNTQLDNLIVNQIDSYTLNASDVA